MTHTRWRRAAMQYGCTQCGAPPGRPCVTDHNNVRTEMHVARTRLASADHWVIEEDQMNICPECAQSKHQNCTNEAWDPVADKVTTCDCYARDHEETDER